MSGIATRPVPRCGYGCAVIDTDTARTGAVRGRFRAVFGAGAGNALEWYDWNVYAVFTTYFAPQFFNSADRVSALLSTLAVFAVGFVARPFGGFLFGLLSDRRGRKFAMTLSIGLAALGSLVIGFAPSYARVGALASVILLLARLIQGLAHGGELPSAQTYVAEYAPAQRRGLWSSLIYVSGTLGNLLGTVLAAILAATLSDTQMGEFGWRIPFLLGGVFGLYVLFMRLRMTETATFTSDVGSTKPRMWPLLVANRAAVVKVIGLTAGFTVVYYVWSVSQTAHAISARGVDERSAFWAGVVGNGVFVLTLPLWGKLSDRVGRKPMLLTGLLATAALVFPLDAIIGHSAVLLGVSMSLAMLLIGMYASILPAVYAELFPTKVRTVAVGIPYSITVAAFGGTAPYLQELIGTKLDPAWFTGYTVLLLLISAAVVLRLPETRGARLDESGSGS